MASVKGFPVCGAVTPAPANTFMRLEVSGWMPARCAGRLVLTLLLHRSTSWWGHPSAQASCLPGGCHSRTAARASRPPPAPAAAGRPGPAMARDSSSQGPGPPRSEEHSSELQSLAYLVCRLLLEKKNKYDNK